MSKHTSKVHGKLNFLIVAVVLVIGAVSYLLVTTDATDFNPSQLSGSGDKSIKGVEKAKKYDKDYWDGSRKSGYGGYKFIDGYWKDVAIKLIKKYDLSIEYTLILLSKSDFLKVINSFSISKVDFNLKLISSINPFITLVLCP